MLIIVHVTTITTIVVIPLPRKSVFLASKCFTWSVINGSIRNIRMKNSMGVELLHRLGYKEQRKLTETFGYKNLTFCSSQPLWWKNKTKKHKKQTKTNYGWTIDIKQNLSRTSKVKYVWSASSWVKVNNRKARSFNCYKLSASKMLVNNTLF